MEDQSGDDNITPLKVQIPNKRFSFSEAQSSPKSPLNPTPRTTSDECTPRRRRKNVFSLVRRASEDGDMDREALPYGEIPIPTREIVRNYIDESAVGIVLDIIQVVLSTAACVIYVVGTYDDNFDKGDSFMIEAEVAMCGFFLLHFALNWYISEDRCLYLFSMEALLDFVTIIPVFLSLFIEGVDMISVGILRSIKVLRVFRILHAPTRANDSPKASRTRRRSSYLVFSPSCFAQPVYPRVGI